MPVVSVTHEAREAKVGNTVQAIAKLTDVSGTPVVIRVEDKHLKNAPS